MPGGRMGAVGSKPTVTAAAATVTFLQQTSSGVDGSSFTFSSQNLGAASAGRFIAVGISHRTTASAVVTAVTVGGVSATQAATAGVTGLAADIWVAAVPTGTTGDVVVTLSATTLRLGIGLYSCTGISTTPNDTAFTTDGNTGVSVDATTGGAIIAAATGAGSGFTWVGATERYDGGIGGEATGFSGASADVAAAATVAVSATSSPTPTLTVAAW